jgi:hypothetical protein
MSLTWALSALNTWSDMKNRNNPHLASEFRKALSQTDKKH